MSLLFGGARLRLPPLAELLEQEYAQTALLVRAGMELCAELAPGCPELWPDFARLLEQGHALAARAGGLGRLDELWAESRLRRRAAEAALPRGWSGILLRRALRADPELSKGEYRRLRDEADFPEAPPLSEFSALLVCTNRRQAAAPLLAFLGQLPPCLREEAALQMAAQLLVGCFAAQFVCLSYARDIAPESELGAILANAGREYDLLERIVEATYPIYLRYYTNSTGGEELCREEYGILLFFFYRDRLEEPLRRLAAELEPLPPAPGQPAEDWLAETMERAIALRHQRFLSLDDAGLRRCLLALLCALRPHPDLDQSCRLLGGLDELCARLKETALGCRMEEERSRLLDGDFSEANRTYADAHSLAQVENGLQFEDFLARLFAGLGYQATPTAATGDHGADLILSKNGVRYALQAKFYSGKVGNKAVQEVYSAMGIWGASAAVVVATSSFTPQARADAAQLGVVLVDGAELEQLLELSGTAAGFAHRFEAPQPPA